MNPTKSVGNFALNFQKEYSKLLLDYIWGRGTMKKLENTQYFKIQSDQELKVGDVLQLVYQAMTEKGYDPQYGARPLKRAIQKYLEDELAEVIIKGDLPEGGTLYVDCDKENDKLKVKSKKLEAKS